MKSILLSTVFVLGLGVSIAFADVAVEVTPTKSSNEMRPPPMEGHMGHNRPPMQRDGERPRGPSGHQRPEHSFYNHGDGHRGPPRDFPMMGHHPKQENDADSATQPSAGASLVPSAK